MQVASYKNIREKGIRHHSCPPTGLRITSARASGYAKKRGMFDRFKPLQVLGVAILAVLLIPGCGNAQELTRSHAAELIQKFKGFRTVSYVLQGQPEWTTKAESDDEPEEEAQFRAIEDYSNYFAEIAVFRYLGLVEVKAMTLERPSPRYLFWKFRVTPSLTAKGRERATQTTSSQDRSAIVLARKEIVSITGITRPREGLAQVEFTWKLIPTEEGATFDSGSAAYKNLPETPQKIISRPTSATFRTAKRKYDEINKSTAVLQRYDDGWRVQLIQ